MARDWQLLVNGMSDIQKLVHLSMRQTEFDVDRIRAERVKARRRAYEDELTIQAERIGCKGRRGRLTAGPILTELNEMSKRDATSIVNTYNYDLAVAIIGIGQATPTANRNTYASRLSEWEARRNAWKVGQIAQYTDGTARARALQDFRRFNDVRGGAVLEPRRAVCPVCQGWVKRGVVPLEVATNNPPPYHVNCPHIWVSRPQRVSKDQCSLLWMGEG